MYKCKSCGKQFVGGVRRDKSQVITDYVEGKQTLNQLASKYGVSSKTISRDLGGMRYVQKISKDKKSDSVFSPLLTPWTSNFFPFCMMPKTTHPPEVFEKADTVSHTLSGSLFSAVLHSKSSHSISVSRCNSSSLVIFIIRLRKITIIF